MSQSYILHPQTLLKFSIVTLETKILSIPDIASPLIIYFTMPIRNVFYSDLTLWSTLTIGKHQRTDVKRRIWQRFLDDLCYLCDTKPGGRTTVSIAVSKSKDGQCFWISANGELLKAVRQLDMILKELKEIQRRPETDLDEVKDKILRVGICRSSMKVRNYLRELQRYLRIMETRDSCGKGKKSDHVVLPR